MTIYDPRKILVPVDLSELSMGGLRAAKEIAELRDAELKVLHVAQESDYMPSFRGGGYPTEFTRRMAIPTNKMLEEAQVELESRLISMLKQVSAGPKVASILLWGEPIEEILRVAGSEDFDLIVMATHGRTGLNRLLIGSVAEQVIRRAPCPVLVIRDKVIGERDHPKVDRKDHEASEELIA